MLQKLCNRYESLNCLVRKRATGSPKELAQKLGISERAWYKLRDELVNELGVPLAYCPVRRTYYYAEEGELVFRFRRKLEDEQMEGLSGGQILSSVEISQFRFSDALFLSKWLAYY